MHRILVRRVMSSPAITIRPQALVADAHALMDEHAIRRLPVVDAQACLVGIIADSDVLEAETAGSVLNAYEPGADEKWLTVEEVMTTDVVTVTADETVGQFVIKLLANKISGLPVVQSDPHNPQRRRVIGVISENDVLQMIADAWRSETGERTSTRDKPASN